MMRMNERELGNRRLAFGSDNAFQSELRRRVDEYFGRTGRRQRDCPQMYLKICGRDVVAGFTPRHHAGKRWELVSFISAKALVLIMTFAIPLLVHWLWVVFLF